MTTQDAQKVMKDWGNRNARGAEDDHFDEMCITLIEAQRIVATHEERKRCAEIVSNYETCDSTWVKARVVSLILDTETNQ